jgi:putative redox protein
MKRSTGGPDSGVWWGRGEGEHGCNGCVPARRREPTELFVASLGSCVAFYAGRFLDRHGIARAGFEVQVAWRMGEGRPARVGQIVITMTPPHAMPPERLPAFLAVARGCTVHHSLAQPPAVDISLSA